MIAAAIVRKSSFVVKSGIKLIMPADLGDPAVMIRNTIFCSGNLFMTKRILAHRRTSAAAYFKPDLLPLLSLKRYFDACYNIFKAI